LISVSDGNKSIENLTVPNISALTNKSYRPQTFERIFMQERASIISQSLEKNIQTNQPNKNSSRYHAKKGDENEI
jgi:hypothetical protein